jgi:hypothetical protein
MGWLKKGLATEREIHEVVVAIEHRRRTPLPVSLPPDDIRDDAF